MSLMGKAQEIKNTIFELYEIFSDKAESHRRDEEFTERIKHDERFETKMADVLSFPKQSTKREENRDISAI